MSLDLLEQVARANVDVYCACAKNWRGTNSAMAVQAAPPQQQQVEDDDQLGPQLVSKLEVRRKSGETLKNPQVRETHVFHCRAMESVPTTSRS